MFKLTIPTHVIRKAAVEAAFQAEERTRQAQVEVSMPPDARPPLSDIHREVRHLQQLARTLARVA